MSEADRLLAAGGFAIPFPHELVDAIAELVEGRLEQRARREYLDSKAAAAYLAMATGRLDKLCSGAIETVERIPFLLEGRRRLFVRQELDRWVVSGGSALA